MIRMSAFVMGNTDLLHISFQYLLVLYVNFSVKPLKFAPKWSISYFQPILAAIFVTIYMFVCRI